MERGSEGKGHKTRRKMGESRSQRLSLMPPFLDGNTPLADHRNTSFVCTISLVKSVQLVQ